MKLIINRSGRIKNWLWVHTQYSPPTAKRILPYGNNGESKTIEAVFQHLLADRKMF